jgi:hypothetical protein
MFGRVISFFSENKSLPSPFSLSGGVETTVGSDKVLTFTTNGTLSVSGSGTIRVLVVGGGAGGGGAFSNIPSSALFSGAGGNGGEVIYNAAFSVSPGSYAVVVGNAGAGGSRQTDPNNVPGYQSSVLGIIAYGGDRGSNYGANGGDKLSGGASARGNDGSNGTTNDINGTSYVYGSGAGSGSISTNSNTRVGGNGGTGAGTGGGGAAGVLTPAPTTGSNYGGGGGGAALILNVRQGDGAAGANGIVIVRYTPN